MQQYWKSIFCNDFLFNLKKNTLSSIGLSPSLSIVSPIFSSKSCFPTSSSFLPSQDFLSWSYLAITAFKDCPELGILIFRKFLLFTWVFKIEKMNRQNNKTMRLQKKLNFNLNKNFSQNLKPFVVKVIIRMHSKFFRQMNVRLL